MSKRLIIGLLSLLLFLTGTAMFFYVSKSNHVQEDSRPKIAASIFPLYDLTKNIAGDKLEVVVILPPGASPHTFEPTPKEQEKLVGTDLIFVAGHELDSWAISLASATADNTKVVTLDKGIELLESESHEEGEVLYDPHYWLSVSNAMIIVDNIAEELSKIDPANENYYQGNAFKYKKELENLREESREEFTYLKTRKIITFHEAFNYFAKEFDLEVVASIEEFPGKEPTIEYLTDVRELIEQHNIKTLFREPELSDSVVKSISEDTDAKIYTLSVDGVGVEGVNSYVEMIRYDVQTIKKALNE